MMHNCRPPQPVRPDHPGHLNWASRDFTFSRCPSNRGLQYRRFNQVSRAPDEAKKVKDVFAPLSADDLSNLPRYAIAAHVMSSQGRAPTVTLKTAPPPAPTGSADYIIERSRRLYGRPVAEVEAELLTRHKSAEPKRRPIIGEMN